MKARIGIVVVAALSGAGLVYSTQGDTPGDLNAYIAEIRRHMMAEHAKSELETIAGIRIGQTDLRYQKGSSGDRYFPSYRATTCPKPGADPEAVAKWRAALNKRADEEIERLRPFADSDGSGFVSTTEGMAFRQLMEFGYLVKTLVQADDGSDDTISAATGLTVEEVRQELKQFYELAGRMEESGLRPLPDVRDP